MLLKNCRLPDGKVKDIEIKEGKIINIKENIETTYPVDKIIDIKNNLTIPGIIDPHCHFREPGMTHKEDLHTGSKSTAAGGITTFFDMPNTEPPTTTNKLLEEKRELGKKSITNYGFHFGAASDNIHEIKKAKNIASTKLFMNITTGKLLIENEKDIKNVFLASKTVSVHAEEEMVERAIKFSKATEKKLYLCHISTKNELEIIKKHKDKNIFAEVTPHHLFLNQSKDKDNFTKMKPPLRTEEDRLALWKAIESGLIDTIGTDHAPHTIKEKNQKETIFGVPGCETMLPLMLNEVNKGNITIQKLIELCCHKPAEIFGIKNKGRLEKGYDADITIIDLDKETTIQGNKLFTKCKWSPFEGLKLKGKPVMTIINGNLVFVDGQINETKKGKEVVFYG